MMSKGYHGQATPVENLMLIFQLTRLVMDFGENALVWHFDCTGSPANLVVRLCDLIYLICTSSSTWITDHYHYTTTYSNRTHLIALPCLYSLAQVRAVPPYDPLTPRHPAIPPATPPLRCAARPPDHLPASSSTRDSPCTAASLLCLAIWPSSAP